MAKTVSARLQQSRFHSDAEAAFVGLLVAAEHALQRLEEACAKHGITHTQYNVLRILRGAHPEGHPRFEIANRLISRAPDVTRLLDRLDRQGLIERGWCPGNRRQCIAKITAKGLDLLRAVDADVFTVQDATMRHLSAEQVRALARAFDTMIP
jgi:DNA-binding MarR family transcriptional regulator